MKVIATKIPGVLLLEPRVFGDARGYFFESWSRARYAEAGVAADFAQDNISRSSKGTIRGLHFQHPYGQGKLVQVVEGEVLDVAVDVRVGSPTFGQWVGYTLSAGNHHQLYIPPGFAHGFCVRSETALFSYKCTEVYHPECERGVIFDDPQLAICWEHDSPMLSPKDRGWSRLSDIPQADLPSYERLS